MRCYFSLIHDQLGMNFSSVCDSSTCQRYMKQKSKFPYNALDFFLRNLVSEMGNLNCRESQEVFTKTDYATDIKVEISIFIVVADLAQRPGMTMMVGYQSIIFMYTRTFITLIIIMEQTTDTYLFWGAVGQTENVIFIPDHTI